MPGKDIGYIRVSTHDQNTARQLDGVQLDKVFEEHASGKNTERPALKACLDYVRDGDVLHVHSIDRLARNLQDLLSIVTTLKEKGVTVIFHKEKLEFVGNGTAGKTDAFQELQLHIIAAVAQFERALILERQREGIAIAKRAGKYKNVGRKPILSNEQVDELRVKLANGERISVLAKAYGVSRQTIYTWLIRQ
ncbi:recombinase family protein [Desulfovibrio sp. OttesenSCG-928-C14]|nr:recombinase family protein [Desulfovibrio sp. OttesenSCG-928-C14]